MTATVVITGDAARIAEAMPNYDIERELGRGGMGVVFLGRHRQLDRGVAIKELPPSFAAEPQVRARFSTEARTLATLSHPHIVPIFDYVERDGLCLIVMEQLPGGTVWDRFTTAGLVPPTACAVVMACCAALQHAHDKGVLHLDVKPDNLMFDSETAVKVTDFGIARMISGDRTLATVDGQVLGTPAYMSPEQARGDDLTPASDVYSAGVMLYELLSGHLPWQGAETAGELLAQRLHEDPVPLREVAPHVPVALADVVMRSLAREPHDRHQRAEDFGVAIGQACVDAWGPSWLDQAGIAIVGSERLSLAARTTSGSDGTGPVLPAAPATSADTSRTGARDTVTGAGRSLPGTSETAVTGGAAPGGPRAPETSAVRRAEGGIRAPGTEARGAASPTGAGPAAPGAADLDGGPPEAPEAEAHASDAGSPPAAPEFLVVRAASAAPRIDGADIHHLEMADLIGVEDILNPPRRPWRPLIVTAVLFCAAALVALLGPGEAGREESLETGQVEIAGVDVVSGGRIELDLSRDVEVAVIDPRLASADALRLEFSVLGIAVSEASAPLRGGVAIVDPGFAQRAVGGAATGTVVLQANGTVLREHEFGIEATQPWYLTGPGLLGILLVLVGLANLESALKPLARGRVRALSFVGAAAAGALLGLSFVALAGAFAIAEPTVASLVAAGLLGTAGGIASARARLGDARRRRVRRAVRRAERSLGVRVTPPAGS